MLFSLTPPSDGWIERVVARESTAELTYSAVGATSRGERPAGYQHDSWNVDVGADEGDRFGRCGRALLGWEAQFGAGMRIVPDVPVALDLTFALVLPLPVAGFVIATARVVDVIDEDDRMGFAYGTLPSHPEEGEEIFLMHRRDGRVSFEVTAFSRRRDPLARLGAPFTRWLQLRTNKTYLTAIQRIADA